ncbi:type IX secretion system ring subunit PorN/GldN [Halocola ammonii]
MKAIITFVSATLLSFGLVTSGAAQTDDEMNQPQQTVLDGAYVKEHNPTKRVIPYPHLREADVMWAKRVWQIIDLREKMNHPLYFPLEEIEDRKSLFQVIVDELNKGSITAYSLGPTDDDDEFRYPMTMEMVDSLLNPEVTKVIPDLETGEDKTITTTEPVSSRTITQFQIKEDWIFDKQRSERYVRIIGIAPMKEEYNDDGTKRGYKTLFWLYFPQCRYVFANHSTFNRDNDAQRLTYEDFFQKRMFGSYIIKEANVYDRSILSYAKGIDALVEAKEIKQELFIMEHDLWHY